MIWADVNPLSCYGTNDGKKAEAAVVNRLGLPKLREMVHDFVSGLIEKNQLAEDDVSAIFYFFWKAIFVVTARAYPARRDRGAGGTQRKAP